MMPDKYRNPLKALLTALAGVAGGVFGLPFGEGDAVAGTEVAAGAYAGLAGLVLWGKDIYAKLTGGGGAA